MSDTDRPTLTKAAEMDVHYCEQEGCEEWGGWGNSPSPSAAASWWCFEHFPHKSFEQKQALSRKLDAAGRREMIP